MEITAIRGRLTRSFRRTDASAASKPVSICLLGQPYWAGKLQENLHRSGGERLKAFYLPLDGRSIFGNWGFRNLQRALTADLIVSVGFRPGAPTLRGRGFDLVWSTLRRLNRRAAGVFYWIGTDVQNTTEDICSGKLRLPSFARACQDHHLADAPWLVEELRMMGITALHKTLTLPPLASGPAAELPARFSVLTYIPDFRYRFYGGETIYEAARRLPQIQFDVVAGAGSWVTEPLPNLSFHGWQRDMEGYYRNASALVRLVEHDGTGLTAIEALSRGRHVVYTFPLPHTLPVSWNDIETLTDTLQGLFDLHQKGELALNTAGKAYVEEHFDHRSCMEDLISYLLEIAPNRFNRETQIYGH